MKLKYFNIIFLLIFFVSCNNFNEIKNDVVSGRHLVLFIDSPALNFNTNRSQNLPQLRTAGRKIYEFNVHIKRRPVRCLA